MSLKFIIMTLVGAGMVVMGIRQLRLAGSDDHVSLIEAAILKVDGSEPLPKTKFDHVWERLQGWLAVVFGSLIFAFGVLLVSAPSFSVE